VQLVELTHVKHIDTHAIHFNELILRYVPLGQFAKHESL